MPQKSKPVPRIRKQKARRRAEEAVSGSTQDAAHGDANLVAGPPDTPRDSNAELLLPLPAAQRDAQKRAIRSQLLAQAPEAKMSVKKRKRLDKYIDVKMRKDENAEVMRKLAAMAPVDTTLMRSSKKLGRGDETRREAMGRALERKRRGLEEAGDDEILMEERREEPTVRSASDPVDGPTSVSTAASVQQISPELDPILPARPHSGAASLATIHNRDPSIAAFGSGLKRPLELDDQGRPMIKRRKKPEAVVEPPQDDAAWDGFSASSSEIDDDYSGVDPQQEGNTSSDGELDEGSTSDTSLTDGSDLEEGRGQDDAAHIERRNAFKAWANQQRNEALGFVSTNVLDSLPSRDETTRVDQDSSESMRRQREERSVASALPKVPDLSSSLQGVFSVTVQRMPEIESARLALPIVAEEQKIMEAIRTNDIVIVCGATGSGKTTQVPQFLFEAGFGDSKGPSPGMIGVTQPRRVAAVSMAKRVAVELGDAGPKVAHQIRFESTVDPSTAVKFMTDGVLLREIGRDFVLSRYSAIVLDEAHERSVNTDILVGMLSRIVETRANLAKKSPKHTPLKLVIMSATMSTLELLENKKLFRQGAPPIVEAEGRQHPVTEHFAKRTERDYIDQAYRKICQGHRKLPDGAMLVFLTGQHEIKQLAKQLREKFASTDGNAKDLGQVRVSAAEHSIEDEDIDLGRQEQGPYEKTEHDDDYDSDASIHGLDDDDDEGDNDDFEVGEKPEVEMKIHLLPLYSQLPADQQMRVFEEAPAGSRLIILATNVAETSLTIPGVRYVFDCGRVKQKQYDKATGVQSFGINWISKASANQRKGRAGRTGPGHCYRLYSSAVYERDFADFTEPEIKRSSLDGVVLQLKSLGIPNVANFPFPTLPDRTSLLKAEQLLEHLGGLSDGKITDMGKQLALFPLSPRLARILCSAQDSGVIDAAISMVAAMSVGEIFRAEATLDIREPEPAAEGEAWTEALNREALEREQRRKDYNAFHASLAHRTTDAFKLLNTLREFAAGQQSLLKDQFSRYAHPKALSEALQLRRQLAAISSTNTPSIRLLSNPFATPTSEKQLGLLQRAIASGYIDQIAQRADLSPTPPLPGERRSTVSKRATDVPYITLFPSSTADNEPPPTEDEHPDNVARRKYAYVHPSSVLAHLPASKLPQFLIYSHLSLSTSATVAGPKMPRTRLHPLCPVSAAQIIDLARGTPLLQDGKPIGRIESLPRDAQGRERRTVWSVPFLVRAGLDTTGAAGIGWPLPPARKVVQCREGRKGWVEDARVAS